jgi:RND family efflux transporter MFP subunit
VRLNAYATSQVTPRIPAQVLARHARLGETVSAGQPLVTLSSVEMAQAQGELVVAEQEWRRVRSLGEKVVSERRYLEARVARQQARARVLAYGMQASQVDALLRDGTEHADGSFQLLAPQAGTVIRDAFVGGELVEPGRVLFEITDEHRRWVEARMPPDEVARVAVGAPARVRDGEAWLEGRVTQIHHSLDEATRTQAVRIEVPDPAHRLHPGLFLDTLVFVGASDPVLAVPEAAVLRSPDGDWQVFVAGDEPGAFVPTEVELLRTAAGLAVIRGLPEGAEVVVHGAFFLQSELAKGGFDIHQH